MKEQLNISILHKIKQIQALAESGIHYARNDFETERYNQLLHLANSIISSLIDQPIEKISNAIFEGTGYKTPKVDIRALVLNDKGELLMVKEKIDGKWSIPGGWADVGYTPSEIAEKETFEEAGMKVKTERLLAIFDKRCHEHPQDIYYVYKLCFLCKQVDNILQTGMETSEVKFFAVDNLPPLSTPRNTKKQLEMLVNLAKSTKQTIYFD